MNLPRLILLSCLPFLAGCADSLVLPENHDVVPTSGLHRRMLDVGGKAVEVWTTRSPGTAKKEPEDFVLFFVGKEDRVERWVQIVADGWGQRPVEVWGMNYPGSGGSQGPTHLASVGPDALATYDALRAEAGARPIFLHAGSFGTVVALCVAGHRPVAGLVLHNPPPLKQLILGRYGWWNLWLLAYPVAMHVPADLDSIANGARCRAPAVFVLSDADQVVPPKYHKLVVDAYAGPKRVIHVPGARHNDPLPREAGEQVQRAMDWLLLSQFSH